MSATATGVPTRRAVGHAIIYNAKSRMISPGFHERVTRGAVEHALRQGNDILALWSHDASDLLARVSNGTLKLESDGKGLHVDVSIADTTVGRDLVTLLERRDVRGLSFDSWSPRIAGN